MRTSRIRRYAGIVVLGFVAMTRGLQAFADDPPLLITLALDRDRTLPGLPVGLRFVAFNRSASAANMPAPFALEIVPPNGEPFLGFWPNENYRWGSIPAEYQGHFSVPPQESREYLITPGDQMTSPAGLLTRHLFTPGTYRLRAGFLPGISEKIDGALEQAHTIAELQAEVAGVVATNEVELHIDPPVGDDLAVWNLILERLGADGWSGMPDVRKRSALAREVWDRYPRSQYAPHMFGVLVARASETADVIRQRMREVDPHHPMLDWFDLAEAHEHALEAGDAVTAERDLSKSLRLAQQARDELAALIQRTSNEVIRLSAQRVVVWTDEDIVIKDRIYSRNDPPPPETSEPVTPFVSCSTTTLNSIRVDWGYENANAYKVTLKIGDENTSSVGAPDGGQPTTFLAGRHENVFTTRVEGLHLNEEDVTWTLNGITVHPDKRHDPKCQP